VSRAALAVLEQLLELPALVAHLEQRIAQLEAERAAARTDDERIDAAEVARIVGRKSRRALDEAFRRARKAGAPDPLEQLAREVEGVGRRWIRRDVVRYVEQAGVRR